jgi:hypothetical protein
VKSTKTVGIILQTMMQQKKMVEMFALAVDSRQADEQNPELSPHIRFTTSAQQQGPG